MIIAKIYKDLKPYLMEKAQTGVKTPYYLIEDKEQVIFVVSSGRNGLEFNKTTGYFSDFPGMQMYQCLYGTGILLMQRNDEFGEAKEFKMVILNSGRAISTAAGWAVCLVNTGNNFLVVLRNSVLEEKYIATKPIKEKRGLVYYVIEKKGEIAFEPNPHYQVHPQITTE